MRGRFPGGRWVRGLLDEWGGGLDVGVANLGSDVVKHGHQDALVDPGPEPRREVVAVELEYVEQDLERASSYVPPRVEGELGQARQEREPVAQVELRIREVCRAPLPFPRLLRGPGRAAVRGRSRRGVERAVGVVVGVVPELRELQLPEAAVRELQRAVPQKSNRVEANLLGRRGRVGERDEAVYAVGERRRIRLGDVLELIADYPLDRLEGELHDGALLVIGRGGEDHEHALPAALDVVHVPAHHLRRASYDQLPDLRRVALPHQHDERPEKLVLERVVRQLSQLQKFHRELPQRIHDVLRYSQVRVASNLGEEIREHGPHPAPYDPRSAAHVHHRDLHELCERKHPRGPRAELLSRNLAERPHELNHRLRVELIGAAEDH
mmetsp:Transcript_3888/g.17171  ORF Transcript_3888/g.17171 Transcript_3888/m.17171 type:complete len:382 (-) Transcript_3888:1241-2386(-)